LQEMLTFDSPGCRHELTSFRREIREGRLRITANRAKLLREESEESLRALLKGLTDLNGDDTEARSAVTTGKPEDLVPAIFELPFMEEEN